jgi:hypothetical protein
MIQDRVSRRWEIDNHKANIREAIRKANNQASALTSRAKDNIAGRLAELISGNTKIRTNERF